MPKTPPVSPAPSSVADAPSPTLQSPPPTQWIVKPGTGLIRVSADEARGLIDAGRARTATPRDLDIAGVSDA